MTDGTMVRFELGFRGGSTTGGLLPEQEWAKLESALRSGNGTVELAGSDQSWIVRVDEVAWVRRHEGSRRLGFGQAAD
jgi:hypothetical protein